MQSHPRWIDEFFTEYTSNTSPYRISTKEIYLSEGYSQMNNNQCDVLNILQTYYAQLCVSKKNIFALVAFIPLLLHGNKLTGYTWCCKHFLH